MDRGLRQRAAALRVAASATGAILAGHSADDVTAMLDALIQEISRHFQDEEAIILASGLPGAVDHVATHRMLVNRVAVMREGLRAGTVDIGELFQFVAHELIAQHILGADRALFRQPELHP